MKYRKQLLQHFLLILIGFTCAVMTLQYKREKDYKSEILKSKLETIADMLSGAINNKHIDSTANIIDNLPNNIRVTTITKDGIVMFDNTLNKQQTEYIENHRNRPEIVKSTKEGEGSAIRFSETNKIDYFYYSKSFPAITIRVAIPYDFNLRNALSADKYIMYFIIVIFFLALLLILYISDRQGRAIMGLNEFLLSIEKRRSYKGIKFPDSEFGEVAQKIVDTYRLLEEQNTELDTQQKKFMCHFQNLDEGISIYSKDRENIYSNRHFIQILNTIIDTPSSDSQHIFHAKEFKEMILFLDNHEFINNNQSVWQGKINKNCSYFAVKLVIFQDSSFEVTLTDITPREKNRELKKEMTNNIAHELKTPVCSISGYLETLLDQKEIEPERQKFFLQRMNVQVKRLSDLIRDIGLITKTEEAPGQFFKEMVSVKDTIDEVVTDLKDNIMDNNIDIDVNVADDVKLYGNHTLLYAIFRNMIENSIKYAGKNIRIEIENYTRSNNHYYFRYSDSGEGVAEEHLKKLFDRFYIVDKGRCRKSSGSGLGLSIVKNAVKYHNGEITAKSAASGGLEFVFSLRGNANNN